MRIVHLIKLIFNVLQTSVCMRIIFQQLKLNAHGSIVINLILLDNTFVSQLLIDMFCHIVGILL